MRDLFFSGCVGKSQSPNAAGVLEKALRVVDEVRKEEGVAGAFERAEIALGIIEGRYADELSVRRSTHADKASVDEIEAFIFIKW